MLLPVTRLHLEMPLQVQSSYCLKSVADLRLHSSKLRLAGSSEDDSHIPCLAIVNGDDYLFSFDEIFLRR
jgi:hypothetical protein